MTLLPTGQPATYFRESMVLWPIGCIWAGPFYFLLLITIVINMSYGWDTTLIVLAELKLMENGIDSTIVEIVFFCVVVVALLSHRICSELAPD